MPENNPITDAELAEVKRLVAAATPGKMSVDRYHTLLDKDGKHVLFTGIQTPMTSGERQDQARANMAEYAALHNAFGPILARLEAAEREHQRVHYIANRLLDANSGLIDTIRKLDHEALCDWHDGIGSDEYLQQWLADRDAQQWRIGAAQGTEQARDMLSMAESGEEADEMMRDAAKRLREEK